MWFRDSAALADLAFACTAIVKGQCIVVSEQACIQMKQHYYQLLSCSRQHFDAFQQSDKQLWLVISIANRVHIKSDGMDMLGLYEQA